MNYGLYLSASGALTNLHRQDVLANNLANAQTVGFKPDTVVSRTRDPERLESGAFTDPKRMLEVLGGGTLAGTSVVQDRQGFLSDGGELDVAFEGPGYLVVEQTSPSGQSVPLLTRDGRFTIDTNGQLASINDGAPLLDVNGRPIVVERGAPIRIHADGRVEQRGTEVASLRIVEPDEPSMLTKVGASRFHAGDSSLRDTRATASLRQNMVEESATDPILTLNAMIDATRAAQGNLKMIQYHDALNAQAISGLGRVS